MASLDSIFNHLVLPPSLPSQLDVDIQSVEKDILIRFIHACATLEKLTGPNLAGTWAALRHSFRICLDLNSGHLEKSSLLSAFDDLDQNQLLILHVVEQNAALFLRYKVDSDGEQSVIFEAFEASPSAEAVLATENALIWSFPGRAVKIPVKEFSKLSDTLTSFLERASMDSLASFMARTSKANASVIEARDTTHPDLIIQMLLPMLEAVGSTAEISRFRKRIRDDVNIHQAKSPWRRSPLYLILRVAAQRHLSLSRGNFTGRVCYKFLICIVLAEFLEECAGRLDPEFTLILRAKLCRRLEKLEIEKSHPIYKQLFQSLGSPIQTIISNATEQVQSSWAGFKRMTTKHIPKLPHRVGNSAIHLTLPNSGLYLNSLLSLTHKPKLRSKPPGAFSIDDGTLSFKKDFSKKVFKLAEVENSIELQNAQESVISSIELMGAQESIPGSAAACQKRCIQIARSIVDYFTLVGSFYQSNPEQMSVFILNLFDLWVRMEKCVIRACPLLASYHPIFRPELLDTLHLPLLSQMRRVRGIQEYLRNRCDGCRYGELSILSEPSENSFAVRYYEGLEGASLRQQHQYIIEGSTESRNRKSREYANRRERYDDFSSKISSGTCVCTRNADGTRSVKGCTRCYYIRNRKRMKIGVHEDFLPASSIHQATVVFELAIPEYLAAYRGVTWRMLEGLAYPSKPKNERPLVMLLRDYTQLQNYMSSQVRFSCTTEAIPYWRMAYSVSLASATKSFLQTHYKEFPLSVNLSDVLLPLGLKFSYCDAESGIWLKDLDKPLTLRHHCGIHVPRSLQASILPKSIHPDPSEEGPSSYEAVASETKCPSDMSVHEFTSYQRLLSGNSRRWLTILSELASSNVNFSGEDSALVFTQLATQIGPEAADVHGVFGDDYFCERLAEQIGRRLRNIASNWRETHCMEMLITLSLRLLALSSGLGHQSAQDLLSSARKATLHWVSRLRDELRNATDAEAADRIVRYGLGAALLCRRTFAMFCGMPNTAIDAENLKIFVQASVALQENLVVDISKLPQHLRNMLLRDMKMAYQIQSAIQTSIKSNIKVLGNAIDETWSDSGNCTGRTYSPWNFVPSSHWVESTITTTSNSSTQTVHLDYIEGHLLLDGKPLGRLPREIREAEFVKELFENQHLLTFPSSLQGMSHFLATPIYGYTIHFGLRRDGLGTESVVIQALSKQDVLEYVPRSVFIGKSSFDLPSALVDDCVHWLNLKSGQLEIRRKPHIWQRRISDWKIDLLSRQAQRKNDSLVDPQSRIYKTLAAIFLHFNQPNRMTVFQPLRGNLSVELSHLELSFFVNKKALLQCRELRAEIDPNQDAGTLYGFESKIVLREVENIDRRSIITSLGGIQYKRNGAHVSVRAENDGKYGKYEIDNVLGRLTCAPEPLLRYWKAVMHAYTSFPLPDSLTGMTGKEEALRTLSSGQCQPWRPDHGAAINLSFIKSLSPEREYYPRDKRRFQTVVYDSKLTSSIQDDRYDILVSELIHKSNVLHAFTSHTDRSPETPVPSQLRRRGVLRSMIYEQNNINPGGDIVYQSRDREAKSPEAAKVYQIVKTLRRQPFTISMTKNLSQILKQWKLIGGFHDHESIASISSSLPVSMNSEIGVNEQWGSLVHFCVDSSPYEVAFQLSLLSFSNKADSDVVQSLAAFACLDELKALNRPISPLFTDYDPLHMSPTLEWLEASFEPTYYTYERTLGRSKKAREMTLAMYRDRCEADGGELARHFLKQWPCMQPSTAGFESTLIDTEQALERILPEWQRLYWNTKLSSFVDRSETILNRYKGKRDFSAPQTSDRSPSFYVSRALCVIPSLSKDLLIRPGFSVSDQRFYLPLEYAQSTKDANQQFHHVTCSELGTVLDSFAGSPDVLRKQYGTDLKRSLAFLKNFNQPKLQILSPQRDIIRQGIAEAQAALARQFVRIRNSLCADDERFKWLRLGNLLPSITPITILETLRSKSHYKYGKHMKENLILFGLLVTDLQRLLRVSHASNKGDTEKLLEEWSHFGHENWDPLDWPDWLLLEIEGNFLIRSEQVDIAHAIMSPDSGKNSVLQLNMGKGKTSVVLPMVAAILADGKQLLRIIVPKALILQTAQVLQSKLGGLVGREIRHIPFSRRTPTTPEMLQLYSELHYQCLRCCGVILAVPEHLLSYKLSGLQRLADSKLCPSLEIIKVQTRLAEKCRSEHIRSSKLGGLKRLTDSVAASLEMIKFQTWLTETCRDVIDETDAILAVRTQLIFPNGPQISLDGHPNRWKVIQIILSLIEDSLPRLVRLFPRGIEVTDRLQGFPIVHLLQTDVEDALHRQILSDICEGRASFLRLSDPTSVVNKAELESLFTAQWDQNLAKQISQLFVDPPVAYKNILIVRGLLLDKILLLCMKKRWGVSYGLHPNRDPVAVPFEAKGVPSEQAEFGHPDVAIILTCLSFYYSGLNPAQFKEALQHVLISDDPASDYDAWTTGSPSLPEALHHWNVINVDDRGQVEELWRHLRLSRNVLNDYMNHFVFPKHAKQFEVKLQASAWDLPQFSRAYSANGSYAKTTGFSGTNDNKSLLPLPISQKDLPSLLHTNAEVLTYLLQRRNRQYTLAATTDGKRWSEEQLLRKLASSEIRVLIDAGAYVLEMDNETLIKTWLNIDTYAKGAVYFGTDNRAWVQYRGSKQKVPLLASPFAESLDGCLVYLDESHTRGTDLKLPRTSRAALTLALGQTKDHTVQAAMRLRQLGTTQSIVFYAPPEVDHSIRAVCRSPWGVIDSGHVVKWLLEQTCLVNQNLQGLYISQGMDFCRRLASEWDYADSKGSRRDEYLQVIQNPERQTLEDLYGKRADIGSNYLNSSPFMLLDKFVRKLNKRRQAAMANGSIGCTFALEEVEQEREIESQVEEIRFVAPPQHREALEFPGLHQALSHFAETGELTGQDSYEHAFEGLSSTEIGMKHNVCSTNSRLFISKQFMRTVKPNPHGSNDNFLRPVEWILYSPTNQTALIVISEEVELLIPIIRAQEKPRVHIIIHTAPVTKNMTQFNDLSCYVLPRLPSDHNIPSWLPRELGIFSGRLYLDFAEYALLKSYLELADTSYGETQSDGTELVKFATNPTAFLLEWLTLRRKGQDIVNTPMGYLCQGRILSPKHSFFTVRTIDGANNAAPSVNVVKAVGMLSEDEDEGSEVDEEWNVVDDMDRDAQSASESDFEDEVEVSVETASN